MSLRTAAVICAVCLGVLRESPAAQQADPEVTLDQVLERAAAYVAKFIVHFSNVVAEERYVQDATAYLPTFNPIGRGRGNIGLAQATPALARHREIRSDFLLVRTAEVAEWQPFRDVYEVDGTPVRDREERVTKLFLQPMKGALSRVDQIQNEGARYNIGDVHRTINHPLVALPYVQAKYQTGVQFVLGKADRGVGPGVWIVEYREQASPTLIRGTYGRDLFATGRFWIEAQTGRLLKSELVLTQPGMRAVITTSFQMDERFGIDVPVEMREQYNLSDGNQLTGTAKYGRFRRFEVRSEDTIQTPPVPDIQ